jgi:hypothetical protein
MVDDLFANAAEGLRLPGGDLVERERLISRSSISQRSEGWTVYGGTASSSSSSSSSATGTCNNRPPSCCTRHPRAEGCSRHRRAVSGAPARFSGTLTLRDDLFLIESASGHGPHHPPAVVRAYEACDGATALAQIRTVSNATLSARARLAAAPLPIVAVIFFGTHYERLPLLRLYEPYFAQTVYMSPRAEIHSALRRTGGERSVAAPAAGSTSTPSWDPWARAISYQCVHGLKATYVCVADIGQRVLGALFQKQAREPQAGRSRAGGLEGSLLGGGVLYFHFDLWVQPWRMLAHDSASVRASRLASLWALPPGRIHLKQAGPTHLMPLECFNASASATYARRHPQWTWARDVPNALNGLQRACGGGACDPNRLCVGWADLYYVPARHMLRFGQLANAFAHTAANAELAVPTIIDILRTRSAAANAPKTASDAQVTPNMAPDAIPASPEAMYRPACWGFCCALTTCPELLARHACGHRMQLSEGAVRDAFAELMRAPPPLGTRNPIPLLSSNGGGH